MIEPPPPKILSGGEGGCLGFVLFLFSLAVCAAIQSLAGLAIGLVIAAIFLGFEGKRSIFVGYILSVLITFGLGFLILTMFCSGLKNI